MGTAVIQRISRFRMCAEPNFVKLLYVIFIMIEIGKFYAIKKK